jgi:hypothetical protein
MASGRKRCRQRRRIFRDIGGNADAADLAARLAVAQRLPKSAPSAPGQIAAHAPAADRRRPSALTDWRARAKTGPAKARPDGLGDDSGTCADDTICDSTFSASP